MLRIAARREGPLPKPWADAGAAPASSMGSIAAFTPGAVLDAHMREQRAFWTRLVREANIQAE